MVSFIHDWMQYGGQAPAYSPCKAEDVVMYFLAASEQVALICLQREGVGEWMLSDGVCIQEFT